MFKQEFVWALIVACLVAILVWWNLPGEDRDDTSQVIARSFVAGFVVAFIVSYFTLSDLNGSDEALKFIRKGKPEF